MNKKKVVIGIAGLFLGLVALTGCATSSGSGSSTEPSTSSTPKAEAEEYALETGGSSLGTIVVGADKMTVYVFDKDTADAGTSVCEGDCATKWPAVVAESATVEAEGVTGTVGTITRTDGTLQVTLNGWPLYYFAGDAAAGDINGQGVGEVWWVVSPSGDKNGTPAA
jgi:predicted lipoprotein with Yx(FWY)xxD motif